jgi:hypothetical protein
MELITYFIVFVVSCITTIAMQKTIKSYNNKRRIEALIKTKDDALRLEQLIKKIVDEKLQEIIKEV